MAWGRQAPAEDEAARVLEAAYEPDRDESLLMDALTLAEIAGAPGGEAFPDRPTGNAGIAHA